MGFIKGVIYNNCIYGGIFMKAELDENGIDLNLGNFGCVSIAPFTDERVGDGFVWNGLVTPVGRFDRVFKSGVLLNDSWRYTHAQVRALNCQAKKNGGLVVFPSWLDYALMVA